MSASLQFRIREKPEKYFYYQHDVGNYTDQVLTFLLFDRHEYIHAESSRLRFWSL